MKIRSMAKQDQPKVSELAAQLGYPVQARDLAERFELVQSSEEYALLVAESSDQKVVGYLQINTEPKTLLAGPRADVAALVVDEHHRGQGVGSALLKAAKEWAKQNKFEAIRVRSNAKRTDAHRFYLRQGFVLSKTSNIFIVSFT
jgi:GNAT superfamily N-acetyltransferase